MCVWERESKTLEHNHIKSRAQWGGWNQRSVPRGEWLRCCARPTRGERGQQGELITHHAEEEELSPKAAWKTHTLAQRWKPRKAPRAAAELNVVKIRGKTRQWRFSTDVYVAVVLFSAEEEERLKASERREEQRGTPSSCQEFKYLQIDSPCSNRLSPTVLMNTWRWPPCSHYFFTKLIT